MQPLPVKFFHPYTGTMLDMLKRLVTAESPTTDKSAVDYLGEIILGELGALEATVTVQRQSEVGNHLVARWGQGQGGFLVLCHMDTVWERGTLAHMPLKEADGKLFGPGALDMKGGIALLLTVLRVLREQGRFPQRPMTALFTADEETGSISSRPLIEDLAKNAAITLCLEPALSNGALKTARKGTGEIQVIVHGRAAHAGADHQKGRNAIEELAYHILEAQKLTRYEKGTTVNVGVVSGGTRSNVVPAEARAVIDVRVVSDDEAARLEEWSRSVKPVLEGTSIQTSFILDRPPMPRDATMIATFKKARGLANQIGLNLIEGSTGGGSDANFVAAKGMPVLDGLGVVGEGGHSEQEYVQIDSLPERAALLAAILTGW